MNPLPVSMLPLLGRGGAAGAVVAAVLLSVALYTYANTAKPAPQPQRRYQ